MMTIRQEEALSAIIAREWRKDGPPRSGLLPILHAAQEEFGYIDEAAIRQIAAALNLTRAEVHGVVSFYRDFRTKPQPLPVIKLCRAEACKARGVEALVDHAEGMAAGKVAIETVYCLGLCSVGPAALSDNSVHAALDKDKLDTLIGAAA